ncbi:MAG TPA: phospholipid carrier-dependent glycosyltransferase, partial [Candidatus Elarobacter sp.]|nr:phospholipid carrier-dependent glycosyltransferase [Candidatus Elarobacter sp.]
MPNSLRIVLAAAAVVALLVSLLTSREDDPVRTFLREGWRHPRDWFSPREGLVAMSRTDVLLAALFAVAAFVLCVLWLRYPAEKVFDEVYYPRAAAEILKHVDIGGHGPFEYTHPPLTKLVIALSILLFGGLPGGDTTLGWRFLNVVAGALMLPLAYAFAKRLTGSTLAASLAAALLLFDGFRFVQARIATPEIVVALLALAVLYAFYRWWTECEVRVHVARER